MAVNPKPLPRYSSEILAWEYDQRQPEPLPGELEWYLKYARHSRSPVLELACGSGRLLIPMAQADYEIHGVDSSESMLNQLRKKIAILNISIQRKITIFRSDILEFSPSQRYDMIVIAYNSLRELTTKRMIRQCFQHVFNILNPGGYFLFTLRRIDRLSLKDGKKVIFDSLDKPFVDEEKRLSVGSKIISFMDSENRIGNEHTYVIKQRGCQLETINFTTYTLIIDTVEYVKMLKDSGFTVQVSSGYSEQPEDGISKEICFVCRKSA
ncbi:MAG: class I SAM-dependent methyltransferase [Dehalococcoidales bacterium]|jgi:SAM-dependent methyltransferase